MRRLPEDLPAALEAFQADPFLMGWVPPLLADCLLSVKRKEMSLVQGLDPAMLCERYRAVY